MIVPENLINIKFVITEGNSALQRQKAVTDQSVKLRKMTLKFFVLSTQMYYVTSRWLQNPEVPIVFEVAI